MSISPLANLRLLLEGGRPQWIPFSMDVGAAPGFSEPILEHFWAATGDKNPAAYFDADIRTFSLPTRFGGVDPAALHAQFEPGTTFDEWGVGHWAGGLPGTVDRAYPPLARAESVDDVQRLPSPVILSDVDMAPVEACHAAGYPVFGYAGSIYEWSWWLRGMEQFMTDLLTNPELAEAILRKVAEHTTRLALASAQVGIDVLCFYDDAGSQRGMQVSPELWRRFVKPLWRGVLDRVRSQYSRAKFFLHCCGKIDVIIPDIIELGFHILHPVQPECMDYADVYRQYSGRIVLTATISSQQTFPFGSPEDVCREVRRLAGIVAADRRAILMPSNVIQPETPWENIVAFAQQCRALRK